MALSTQDARTLGRLGGLTYAATTPPDELSRRGRHAFAARMARLEREADPDGTLAPDVRRRRARLLLRRQMAELSHKALKRRRSRPLPEGYFPGGERNPAARHPDATVARAIELYANGGGWPLRRIAEAVGADHGTVGRWCRGDTRRGTVR